MDRCYLESAEAASRYVGKNVMSCRYAPIAEEAISIFRSASEAASYHNCMV